MARRFRTATMLTLTLAAGATSVGAQTGVRDVSASERSVIPLQTRLRYDPHQDRFIVEPWLPEVAIEEGATA